MRPDTLIAVFKTPFSSYEVFENLEPGSSKMTAMLLNSMLFIPFYTDC